MGKTIIIGLTGPTGAGKSALRPVAEELGFRYIDCDLLSRRAVEPGTDALAKLADRFGRDIIRADGTLDRPELARRAFPTAEGRNALNAIVHPAVIGLVMEEVALCGEEDIPAAVVDAPTLFESGLDARCHAIIAVTAPDQCRLERIMARDRIDGEAAGLRMAAQHPCEYYSLRADYTIPNDSDLEAFRQRARQVLTQILKGETK